MRREDETRGWRFPGKTGSDVCLGRVGGRPHNLVERPQINNTQGRAGTGVSECSELDQRAIVHWRFECGRFAEGRGVCDTCYVGKWLGGATPVSDDGQSVKCYMARRV